MNGSQSHVTLLTWPHSRAGTIGVALTALFLVVLGINLWASGDGDQNGFLVFATFITALGALAGLVLSVVAILRQHERSLLVWLPLVVGVLVVAFLAIDIIAGHG